MSETSSNAENLGERPKIAEHYCITSLKEASTSMQWTITDFDLSRMDASHCLESCSFESVSEDGISTGKWRMKLVPKYSKKDTVGLFFTFSDDMADTFGEFQACIIDENGKERNKMEQACDILHCDIGFEEFIKKSSLVDSMLPDGFLIIRGEITVVHMNSTHTKSGELDTGTSLSQDFCRLMKEEILKDAVLICGDRKFPIHKCILSARSSVFSTLFTGEWKEKDSVEIKDMEADVLENLIFYIYTDSCQDFTTVDMVIKLLQGADRYGLLELKGICEDYLKKNISIPNLFEVASAAELHSLDSVKAACITFMCEHGKEIVLSDNFKDFFKNAPQYLVEGVLKRHFGDETLQKEKFPSFVPQASPKVKKQVTSCPSCEPSLYPCTSAAAFPVIPDQPSGFVMPLQPLKFPTFNFGQDPK